MSECIRGTWRGMGPSAYARIAEIISGSCATSTAKRFERTQAVRNCTKDEGRPFGAALQGEASNHLKLLWSKASVVSVEEKAHKMCQVGTKKMSESEPRMTRRNVKGDIKTRVASRSWDELGGFLLTVRAVSGVYVA